MVLCVVSLERREGRSGMIIRSNICVFVFSIFVLCFVFILCFVFVFCVCPIVVVCVVSLGRLGGRSDTLTRS